MPELPDVETMRRYLESTSLYQEIAAVNVEDRQVVSDLSAEKLTKRLMGRSFVSTERHGKYLFVMLDQPEEGVLVLHFGVTGGLRYFCDRCDRPEYTRVLIRFANGYHLAYHAIRKLGQVAVTSDVERFVDRKKLGPDVLDPDFDLAAFREVVDGRQAMTKAVLVDQQIMAGIGNVYGDEILFQTRVHPRTRIDKLNDAELADLFRNMKLVLQTAIDCQADPDRFPNWFLAPLRHERGRCPLCDVELRRVKVSSRTSYFCPRRQRQISCGAEEDG